MHTYCFDFETYYDNDTSLTKTSVRNYLRNPEVDVYCCAVTGDDGTEAFMRPVYPDRTLVGFNVTSLRGKAWRFISHNAGFDYQVYQHLQEIGWFPKDIVPTEVMDTADLAPYLCGCRNLKDAAKVLLKKEHSKKYRLTAKGKRGQDFTADEWVIIKQACLDDAHASLDIWTQYEKHMPAWEKQVSVMTRNGCMQGVRIDVAKAAEYVRELAPMVQDAEETLSKYDTWNGGAWRSDYKTPVAQALLTKACTESSVPLPPTFNKSEEEFQLWLDEYADEVPWVGAVKMWAGAAKLHDACQSLIDRADSNGIMTFGLKYFGAGTGRWSGDGGFNMQNFAWKHMIDKDCPYKHVDIRGLIIPRQGNVFLVADESQIEARTLNWLAGNTKFLKACETVSPYEAAAINAGKWDPKNGSLKKMNEQLYSYYKGATLAFGYQAGWKKGVQMFASYGIDPYKVIGTDVTESQIADFKSYLEHLDEFMKTKRNTEQIAGISQRKLQLFTKAWLAVTQWREDNNLIKQLWNKMGASLEAHIGEDIFRVKLPSGRYLSFYYPSRLRGEIVCWPNPLKKLDKKNGPKKMYGGKVTQNTNQALARDIFAWALCDIKRELDIEPLWTVHDEVIYEVPEANAKGLVDDIKRIMTTPPPWVPGLPLGTDPKIVERYCK